MIFEIRPPMRGFSLVELLVVVALLGILGSGAILGLKRQRENANFAKAARNLAAIDLAKQTWQQFHPNTVWPTGEVDRWQQISNYLGTATFGIETPSDSQFYAYPAFAPDGYTYHLGELTAPASGRGEGATINRRP